MNELIIDLQFILFAIPNCEKIKKNKLAKSKKSLARFFSGFRTQNLDQHNFP